MTSVTEKVQYKEKVQKGKKKQPQKRKRGNGSMPHK
jgi:hypothetical protein